MMKFVIFVTAACLLVCAPIASADVLFTSNLDLSNCTNNSSTLCDAANPYGQVTATFNPATSSTPSSITINATLYNGFTFTQNAFGFNVITPSDSIALLAGTTVNSLVPPTYTLSSGSQMEDGFGDFSRGITGPNPGSGNTVSTLNFSIVDGTTAFTSVNAIEVLSTGNGGVQTFFAAHVFDSVGSAAGTCGGTSQPSCTGFVGENEAGVVPEPFSILLLGTVLVPIAAALKRKIGVKV